MAGPVNGSVVRVWFPYKDQYDGKPRPALVIISKVPNELTICMITSQKYHNHAVSFSPVVKEEFTKSAEHRDNQSLNKTCWIVPNVIATIEADALATDKPPILGQIADDVYLRVIDSICDLSALLD